MNGGGDRPGVVWFRRDLRLDDNPAWAAATSRHAEVVACFVMEPGCWKGISSDRHDVVARALADLDGQLQHAGGRLVVRSGPAGDALAALSDELGGVVVYTNRDGSRFSRARERAVREAVSGRLECFDGNVVHPHGSVLTNDGHVSRVFTPFHRRWAERTLPARAEPGPGLPIELDGEALPCPSSSEGPDIGAAPATRRLEDFLERVGEYSDRRDMLAVDATSGLSIDLKFGTISARDVVERCGEVAADTDPFVRQLAWRDWWAHTLMESPELDRRPVREEYSAIEWIDDQAEFDAWCDGRTGVPVVDAGMRQLRETGCMHNRARMICASYLVKDLLVDWRLGERHFRRYLLDYDVSQNAGNWQWVAGTGPDAAPYFRIFNPVTQSRRFDPDGEYIRRWVPELADVSSRDIHEPSTAAPLDLAAAGVVIGDTYPEPLVNHAEARERTLSVYAAAKEA